MKPTTIPAKDLPIALLVVLVVIAGAGAAAGVTFEGEVRGDAVSKVDQALILNGSNGVQEVTGNVSNALGKVSDDGTKFRFAANVHQGDKYKIHLNLTNLAAQPLNGRLRLRVPAPLEVDVNAVESDEFEVARTSLGSWNFRIQPEDGDDVMTVEIVVAVPDDAQPGFYTIEAQIQPSEV